MDVVADQPQPEFVEEAVEALGCTSIDAALEETDWETIRESEMELWRNADGIELASDALFEDDSRETWAAKVRQHGEVIGEFAYPTGEEFISFVPRDIVLVGKVIDGEVRTDIVVNIDPERNVYNRSAAESLIERLQHAIGFLADTDE